MEASPTRSSAARAEGQADEPRRGGLTGARTRACRRERGADQGADHQGELCALPEDDGADVGDPGQGGLLPQGGCAPAGPQRLARCGRGRAREHAGAGDAARREVQRVGGAAADRGADGARDGARLAAGEGHHQAGRAGRGRGDARGHPRSFARGARGGSTQHRRRARRRGPGGGCGTASATAACACASRGRGAGRVRVGAAGRVRVGRDVLSERAAAARMRRPPPSRAGHPRAPRLPPKSAV
mmetsp:Transcript_12822/g.42282  ORF Transcript_12822/g.42282 Transcript_12822/m.42282 type:complete len:243 (+) Transcript_12822:1181-1909(+)